MEKLANRLNALSDGDDREELRFLLEALLAATRAVAAKLDADATVTDTDYAATVDAIIVK